ncbi:MAG TPA: hypothetical protein PLW24_11250, partial [Burkholderiaceae bacterium]|nr:hypothetical protein [Burkholderiaceae bacterium]
MAGLLGSTAAPSAQAASFNWSSPTCITTVPCTGVGSKTRYANAVTGTNPRDIILEIVRLNGATVYQAPGFQMAADSATQVFIGRISGNAAAGAKSQVVMRLTFVNPGTEVVNPLAGPIYLTSQDTDGNGNPTLGVRERVEFISPPATYQWGSQLESTAALDGGIPFATKVCVNSTDAGCTASTGFGSAGNYVNYTDLSVQGGVAVTAWYVGSISSIDFAYGAEVGTDGTGSNPIVDRLFGLSGGAGDAADMSPAFGGIPGVIRPGQVLTGVTLTCTNSATATAAAAMASCVPTVDVGTISALSCTPASGSSIAAGSNIRCTFNYTAPGSQGGGDEPNTVVTFTGSTGASNDTNTANNTTSASASVIDALDEAASSTPAGTPASVNVLGNDQVGTSAATTSNVSITQLSLPSAAGLNFDTATGVLSTSAATPVGSYVLTYQICANPAQTPAACDQASATINVTAGPNMTAAVSIAPTIAGPGTTVSGSISCSNKGGAAATNASCTASAVDSSGAAVAVTVGACTASSGSAASLPVDASLSCPISYTQPGTANSGTNTVPTSVTVTANTSATNEPASNSADNSASDSVAIIDALDEAASSTPAGTPASVNVLGNDQVGTSAATTSNVSITQLSLPSAAGLNFDTATGVLSTSAATPVGSYVLTYQICANPAQTPAACDQASATINVTSPPDMAAAISGLPTALRPGQQ